MALRNRGSGSRCALTILQVYFTPVQVSDAPCLPIGTITLAGPCQRRIQAPFEDLGLIIELN